MRLKSFRILRYKSIVDSGECTLSPDYTVLIGKNESGKTAVLEALRDFDRERSVLSRQAVPINGVQGQPQLELTFEVSSDDLQAAAQQAGVAIPDDLRRTLLKGGIKLSKTFEGEYRFSDPMCESLFGGQHGGNESDFDRITAKKQRLSEILKVYPVPDLKLGEDVQALQESINDLRRLVKSRLNFISDESQKVEAVEILHSMTNAAYPAENRPAKPAAPSTTLLRELLQKLPRFIYFSDFKDLLPFEIAIDELKDNQTVVDFARLAQLDLDAVMSAQDTQRRINLLNRASAVITGAFFDHWQQDRIELMARPEGNKILFGVKEHSGTDFYKMEQRSRGFQWFLSFYLRINRYQNEAVVLLIDEPGMNLHPMAQANILQVVEQSASSSMQIIFSTHSPALIDPQRLDRLRYVVKDKRAGTALSIEIGEGVDAETLMPVSMATGLSYEQLRALPPQQPAIVEEPVTAEIPPQPVEEKTAVEESAASPVVPVEPLTESVMTKEAPPVSSSAENSRGNETDGEDMEYLPARKSIFKFFGR